MHEHHGTEEVALETEPWTDAVGRLMSEVVRQLDKAGLAEVEGGSPLMVATASILGDADATSFLTGHGDDCRVVIALNDNRSPAGQLRALLDQLIRHHLNATLTPGDRS